MSALERHILLLPKLGAEKTDQLVFFKRHYLVGTPRNVFVTSNDYLPAESPKGGGPMFVWRIGRSKTRFPVELKSLIFEGTIEHWDNASGNVYIKSDLAEPHAAWRILARSSDSSKRIAFRTSAALC